MNAGYVPSGYGEKSGVMLLFGRVVSPLPHPPPGRMGGQVGFCKSLKREWSVCCRGGFSQTPQPRCRRGSCPAEGDEWGNRW